MKKTIQDILKSVGLRDTNARRLVLKLLMASQKPLTHKDIHQTIQKQDAAINLVTVYRIVEKFEELGLVHRHRSSGGFILCSLAGNGGHHILLSCEDCGEVEELHDEQLCKHEDAIAKSAGFVPKNHMSEIVGTCSKCQ